MLVALNLQIGVSLARPRCGIHNRWEGGSNREVHSNRLGPLTEVLVNDCWAVGVQGRARGNNANRGQQGTTIA